LSGAGRGPGDVLRSDAFVDMAPPQVYDALLDAGAHLGSISTMYRLLRQNDEVHERRNQMTHKEYAPPELMATGPDELWSWDITKLRGASKGICYDLYVILDVFSRYVVGWTLQTCEKQAILPGRLTVHADRGIAMVTPEATHYGSATRVLEKRADVLKAACAAHPERFVRTNPVPLPLPTAVWINPPLKSGIVNNRAQ